eukprot:TRINITY_DN10340_c0_g3_i2.p2 TRINITY_DN10340_c0_g3~~TRINITY_DN10340_c0_g3_i2.p2  ORF type:complete len:172 (+),score=35.27 TRINITY_DN10340_c0_g3_i2:522-1037(+)
MMAPLVEEEAVTQAVPTALMSLENGSIFAGLSNGKLEKIDVRKDSREREIEVSRSAIVGLVSLEHNSIIAADCNGIIKEVDLRNYEVLRTTNLNEQINCLTIIRPGCLLIGTQHNFQILDALNNMNVIYVNDVHEGSVRSIHYAESDRLLFTGGYDKRINVFQLSPCICWG